jgi:hypothetical protein
MKKYVCMPMNRVLERRTVTAPNRAEAMKKAKAIFGNIKLSVIGI